MSFYKNTTIFTLTILFLSTFAFVGSIHAQDPMNDEEFLKAADWMHEKSMTIYRDPRQFGPEKVVLREHAAKFFSEYSSKVAFKTMNTDRYCDFKDLEQADKTLKNYIIQSCFLNVFYGTQGMFYPTRQLTKAEAIVAMVRVREGKLKESDNAIWRENYTRRAYELGLSKETDAAAQDRPITRYEIALLIYRSAQKQFINI